jgi:putative flippase GtrA
MRRLLGQFARFGVVGGIGLVVDLGVFNLLLATVLAPERVHEGPVIAKVISSAVAIVCNWLGNRFWTFRAHRGRQLWREGLEFAVVSVAGMLIGVGCLWVSHYLLGFTSRLADNVAGNGIGLVLGTLFRFTLYRWWVFRPHRGEAPTGFEHEAETAELPDADPEAPVSEAAGVR